MGAALKTNDDANGNITVRSNINVLGRHWKTLLVLYLTLMEVKYLSEVEVENKRVRIKMSL